MRALFCLLHKNLIFLTVCLCLLVLSFSSVASKDNDSLCQIVTFMPDFYAFWQEAKSQPLEKRVKLWDQMFESKHADFYNEAIYSRRLTESIDFSKEQQLKEFLRALSEKDIQMMRAKEQELTTLIPIVAQKVHGLFSAQEESTSHFIIPSLNVTTGAGAPYKGDLIIFYGIEFIAGLKNPEYIQEMIAHQILHVIHYRKLAPALWKKYGKNGNLNALLDREGPLFFIFREGLAISFAESLFPGGDRPGIQEKNLHVFEQNFKDYTEKFLRDLRNFTPEVYANYFSSVQKNSEPPGFGFYLGYTIVKSLLREHPLEELLLWSPERAVQAMWRETNSLLK